MITAYQGALVADALAMPVHWYYDRAELDQDYPDLKEFRKPLALHTGSILWRSSYEPLNEKGNILHDQAQYWGQPKIHYHQNLTAGENTVNFKLSRELYHQVNTNKDYSEENWLELFVEKMLTPGWHRDTYLEEYHRGFFTNYAKGKQLRKCGIKDNHIGGLAQVPALVTALTGQPRETVREHVKHHVTLTHRHSNVLRAADCLTRLLLDIADGVSLRDAVMQSAGDWFSTKKAIKWSSRPDREVVGRVLSSACYIDQSFPAALYLAWKYHDDFTGAIIANALVGGDSCHRGAVVGSLVGLQNPIQVKPWSEDLAEKP